MTSTSLSLEGPKPIAVAALISQVTTAPASNLQSCSVVVKLLTKVHCESSVLRSWHRYYTTAKFPQYTLLQIDFVCDSVRVCVCARARACVCPRNDEQ